MKNRLLSLGFLWLLMVSVTFARTQIYSMREFSLSPNQPKKNASVLIQNVLNEIKRTISVGDSVVLKLEAGDYHFYENGAVERTYYISNHDHVDVRKIGINIEDFHYFTLDGGGANLVFHGLMLPIAMLRSENCTLRNFSIDFKNPHIAQVRIVSSDSVHGIVFEPAEWVEYGINKQTGVFELHDGAWRSQPNTGIAFESASRHIVYRTSDLQYSTKNAKEISPRKIHAPHWKDARLQPGMVVAMRTWLRPNPGIFLSHNVNTRLENVKIRYADGMGLLAQFCENITLNDFAVALKGDNDLRYFTTQADATHFSSCKGKIESIGGLYEGMMDDAINVHGTYLKIVSRLNERTVVGRYMHGQSYGFEWGRAGDEVQFVASETMDVVAKNFQIAEIQPYGQTEILGARAFLISFTDSLPAEIREQHSIGIENLTWSPEVLFQQNIVRNNRARGALFSTPRRVQVLNNLFDHTSGTAILLCGDCNGWYETGACCEVLIRGNRFVNALTNLFQFTEAVISICPEVPSLDNQKGYFHSDITIEDNVFETFDHPILYAKSVNGLVFRNNKIVSNNDYPAFHRHQNRFILERVTNVKLEE